MFNFQDNERTPTIKELEKRYGTKFKDGKYPFGETDNCCCEDRYIMDFISHRHQYHKIPVNEIMLELDQFMAEIFDRHIKLQEDMV